MDSDRIVILLPANLRREAAAMAEERDVTIGQVIRDLLRLEIAARREATAPDPLLEVVAEPLRARLEGDLARATGWDDLQRRLRARGFALREAGGGLALHEWPGGRKLCKASDLGHGYAQLMRRFGEPFPGHRQRWLADRILGRDGRRDCRRGGPEDDAVIERP